jgi:hypothetical protein
VQLPLAIGSAPYGVVAHPDVLCEEINEGAHARWQRPGVADVDRMDIFAVPGIVVLEDRNQASGLDVGTDVE